MDERRLLRITPGPPTVSQRVDPAVAATSVDGAEAGRLAPGGTPRRFPASGLLRLAVIAAIFVGGWYQSYDFVGVLSLAAIWGVATVGLGLVLGAAGQISLCQASLAMVGAYLYAACTVTWHVPTLLGLLAGVFGGGIAALLISPVLRTRGNFLALATIAVSLLATQIATSASWIPGGVNGVAGVAPLKVGPLAINTETRYLLLTIGLLVVIIAVLHRRYGVGHMRRAIQTLHHDEGLLAASGRGPWFLKLNVFVVGGLLAGLAGTLYAGNYDFVSPDGFGLQESFALALAVLIGGGGSLIGAVLGAVVYQMSYTILPNSLVNYRFALLGAIVIATMHFFPRGLVPRREDFGGWVPRVRRHRLPPEDAEHHELDPVVPLGVEISGVTKRFGALCAIDQLTLSIAPGTLTALIGPNGAGKTTLLDLIAGDQLPSSGRIAISGADVAHLGVTRRSRMGIARTYQRVRLVPSLNVIDNVLVGVDHAARSQHRVSEAERVSRARAALDDVGLADRVDSPVNVLPFGERRLVEMARAIAARPRLVLLDEPSSGLNDGETEAFAGVISRLHQTGCTVVLVEHNLPFVQSLAQDIVVLNFGRLLAQGETQEVFALRAFQEAYVGVAREPV